MVRHQEAGRSYWTLPGGAIEPGETAAAAVEREFLEETGLRVRSVGVLFVDGGTTCYEVALDGDQVDATLVLGTDPEEADLLQEERMLQDVAWRRLDALSDDPQVGRILRDRKASQCPPVEEAM